MCVLTFCMQYFLSAVGASLQPEPSVHCWNTWMLPAIIAKWNLVLLITGLVHRYKQSFIINQSIRRRTPILVAIRGFTPIHSCALVTLTRYSISTSIVLLWRS